jgi:hypothetical protein
MSIALREAAMSSTIKRYTSPTSGWDEEAATIGSAGAQMIINVGNINTSIAVDESAFGLWHHRPESVN